MKNICILLLFLLPFASVAQKGMPIKDGKLTTPLNANGQSITNVPFVRFSNGTEFDGNIPAPDMSSKVGTNEFVQATNQLHTVKLDKSVFSLATNDLWTALIGGTNSLWQFKLNITDYASGTNQIWQSLFAIQGRTNNYETAYTHSQSTGNVHGLTAGDIGAYTYGDTLQWGSLYFWGNGWSKGEEMDDGSLYLPTDEQWSGYPSIEMGTLASRNWVNNGYLKKTDDSQFSANSFALVAQQTNCFAVVSNNMIYVYEIRVAGQRGTNEMVIVDTDVLVDDFFVLQAPVIGTRFALSSTEGDIKTFTNANFPDHAGHTANDYYTPVIDMMFTSQAFVGCTVGAPTIEPQVIGGFYHLYATPGVINGTFMDVIVFQGDYTVYPTGGLETNLVGNLLVSGVVTNFQPEVSFSNLTLVGDIVFPNGVRMTGREQLNGSNTVHFVQPNDTTKFYITFPPPPM